MRRRYQEKILKKSEHIFSNYRKKYEIECVVSSETYLRRKQDPVLTPSLAVLVTTSWRTD